jgi:hypothetical protein
MGSSGTEIQYPSAPAAQTTAQSMADYVQSLPALYQAQMQYEPQLQAMNLGMLQQYGTQFGEAYKNINDAMYPETAKLQEQLATQASQGISGDMPQWAKDSYRSEMGANLGTNAGSGIGADYASRGMLEQQKGWQDYYSNLGLSVAGRQPLAQGGTTGQTNYMQGYQPAQALNYAASNYGNYMSGVKGMQAPVTAGGVNLGIFGQWGAR